MPIPIRVVSTIWRLDGFLVTLQADDHHSDDEEHDHQETPEEMVERHKAKWQKHKGKYQKYANKGKVCALGILSSGPSSSLLCHQRLSQRLAHMQSAGGQADSGARTSEGKARQGHCCRQAAGVHRVQVCKVRLHQEHGQLSGANSRSIRLPLHLARGRSIQPPPHHHSSVQPPFCPAATQMCYSCLHVVAARCRFLMRAAS